MQHNALYPSPLTAYWVPTEVERPPSPEVSLCEGGEGLPGPRQCRPPGQPGSAACAGGRRSGGAPGDPKERPKNPNGKE